MDVFPIFLLVWLAAPLALAYFAGRFFTPDKEKGAGQ